MDCVASKNRNGRCEACGKLSVYLNYVDHEEGNSFIFMEHNLVLVKAVS